MPFTATPTDNSAQLSSEITNYSLLIQSDAANDFCVTLTFPSSSSRLVLRHVRQFSAVFGCRVDLCCYSVVVIVVVAVTALAFLRKRRNLPPATSASPIRITRRIHGFRLFNVGENRRRVSEIIEGVSLLFFGRNG